MCAWLCLFIKDSRLDEIDSKEQPLPTPSAALQEVFGATFELADILEVELNTNLSRIMLDWCAHDLPRSPSISLYLPLSPSISLYLPLSPYSFYSPSISIYLPPSPSISLHLPPSPSISLHLPALPDHTRLVRAQRRTSTCNSPASPQYLPYISPVSPLYLPRCEHKDIKRIANWIEGHLLGTFVKTVTLTLTLALALALALIPTPT